MTWHKSYPFVLILTLSFGAALMLSQWWHKPQPQTDTFNPVDCDLNLGSCDIETAKGKVTLTITPRPIRPLKPLQAVVTLQGFKADRVELVFTGIDVDMGRFSYLLQQTEDGIFKGRVTLSICSQNKMIWQALVVIDEALQLPFRFESEYKPQFIIVE
ncbi:MAG: hypothetical protein GQ470_01510 [Gammaproteobacteria bacterium]|nr:hypothetical protein [Gammaproteobacteria bacterium]